MSTKTIFFEGEDVLRKKCKPVKSFNKNISKLLDDMYKTIKDEYDCGISAPQVGVSLRVFIVQTKGMKIEFINPEILEQSGCNKMKESCFSIPNRSEDVERPTKIKVKAFTREGTPFEMIFNDKYAGLVCHQLDHLNGELYTDKKK